MNPTYANLERLAACPIKYIPTAFFEKYITAYLAPIYSSIADSLGRRTEPSFRKVWAWESAQLLNECGIGEELGDTQNYATHPRDFSLPGASFRLSEVYKSAFMRTVAWFAFAGQLSEGDFKTLSLMTCPIDTSLWNVLPQSPPKWWPRSPSKPAESAEKPEDLVAPPWPQICDLANLALSSFEPSRGRILAARGACLLQNGERDAGARLRFTLLGFAYRVLGPRIPSADEVVDLILMRPRYLARTDTPHIASILDSAANGSVVHNGYSWTNGSSLKITALVSRLESYPIYTWQWYRAYDLPFALSPLLTSGLTMRRSDSSWNYVSSSHEIARIYDWRIGALERDPKNSFPLHGQVVEVDFDWLSDALAKEDMSLGYVLRTNLKVQNRSYEAAKEFKHTELLGVSRIITPGEK